MFVWIQELLCWHKWELICTVAMTDYWDTEALETYTKWVFQCAKCKATKSKNSK